MTVGLIKVRLDSPLLVHKNDQHEDEHLADDADEGPQGGQAIWKIKERFRTCRTINSSSPPLTLHPEEDGVVE